MALGEPPIPGTPPRPRWVGVAARLMTDPGEAVLRVGDPTHARLLRQMGARGLHEPLLEALPGCGPGNEVHAAMPLPTPARPLVAAAGRALRALLPGNPKPVAALTRAPEVVALLLRAYDTHAGHEPLAASVLFSLALSSALQVEATLIGPFTLQHSVTRRGIVLAPGQALHLTSGALWLDGVRIDPWGPELGSHMSHVGPFAALRTDVVRLPGADVMEAATRRLVSLGGVGECLCELFDGLELAPSEAVGDADASLNTLPLAIGRARLQPSTDPDVVARTLLREGVLHRLALLRLLDPLVHGESALGPLAALADDWAGARLGLHVRGRAPGPSPDSLTSLGQRVAAELAQAVR